MHDLREAAFDVPDRGSGRVGRRAKPFDASRFDRVIASPPSAGPDAGRPTVIEVGVDQAERTPAAQYSAGGSGSFFRACILLLLSEKAAHGYDILERLTGFGFDSGDSGWLYRTLRLFERDQVVASEWEMSSSGPPRRVYALTVAGYRLLGSWVVSVRASQRTIEGFLTRYDHTGGVELDPEGGEAAAEER